MNMLTDFTVEEINFICCCFADTREETISKIFEVLPKIEDKDMLAIGERVINKLDDMSDEDFIERRFNEMYAE